MICEFSEGFPYAAELPKWGLTSGCEQKQDETKMQKEDGMRRRARCNQPVEFGSEIQRRLGLLSRPPHLATVFRFQQDSQSASDLTIRLQKPPSHFS